MERAWSRVKGETGVNGRPLICSQERRWPAASESDGPGVGDASTEDGGLVRAGSCSHALSLTWPNGSGSYTFLLDQHGVRIVDPNSRMLCTAGAPLSSPTRQHIQARGCSGLNARQVPVIADTTLQNIQSQRHSPTSLQDIPAGQQGSFPVGRQQLTIVPWTCFTLTPVSAVEAVANQQLLIPAAAIGRRISFPVLPSVKALKKNSATLNEPAEAQVASVQGRVLDASTDSLKAVVADTRAFWRLNDLRREQPLHVSRDRESLTGIARYLGAAIDHQDQGNKRAADSSDIARQLACGARSTSEVGRAVKALRQAIGRRP